MLPSDPAGTQISEEQFVEVCISGVLSNRSSTDLAPDLATRNPIAVIDGGDDLKVHLRVVADPVDEHPHHVVARESRGCGIGKDVSNVDPFLFALHAGPVTEGLLEKRLESLLCTLSAIASSCRSSRAMISMMVSSFSLNSSCSIRIQASKNRLNRSCSASDQTPAIADSTPPASGMAPPATCSAAREILATLPGSGLFPSARSWLPSVMIDLPVSRTPPPGRVDDMPASFAAGLCRIPRSSAAG